MSARSSSSRHALSAMYPGVEVRGVPHAPGCDAVTSERYFISNYTCHYVKQSRQNGPSEMPDVPSEQNVFEIVSPVTVVMDN
jgi:hypothetical protein